MWRASCMTASTGCASIRAERATTSGAWLRRAGEHRANAVQAWVCWLGLRLGGWIYYHRIGRTEECDVSETIDRETPVTVRVGALAVAAGLIWAAGAWANDISNSLRALPEIKVKIDELDKNGTTFGRTGDQLIRKDIERLTEKVAGIQKDVRGDRRGGRRQVVRCRHPRPTRWWCPQWRGRSSSPSAWRRARGRSARASAGRRGGFGASSVLAQCMTRLRWWAGRPINGTEDAMQDSMKFDPENGNTDAFSVRELHELARRAERLAAMEVCNGAEAAMRGSLARMWAAPRRRRPRGQGSHRRVSARDGAKDEAAIRLDRRRLRQLRRLGASCPGPSCRRRRSSKTRRRPPGPPSHSYTLMRHCSTARASSSFRHSTYPQLV